MGERLGKVIMFKEDRARQHLSKKVLEYLKENKDAIRIVYLPKGSPEFNAVEEAAGDREIIIYWCQNIIPDLQISKQQSLDTTGQ